MNKVSFFFFLAGCLSLPSPGSTQAADSRSWVFVSLLEQKQIVSFERNPANGELAIAGVTECAAEPAAMGVSRDRRTLFVSLRSTGELATYRIDSATGRLTLRSVVDGGEDPAYLISDPADRYLLSAYYASNKVVVHGLSKEGALSAEPVQTVPTAQRAHGIALNSKGDQVYVTHTGANRIYQFRFDKKDGRLWPSAPPFLSTPAENHPRHITLHPSDRWAYTSNEAGDSLGVYRVDPDARTLSPLQTVSTIPAGFDGSKNSTARCEMTPDGRFVYVANRGHDSIAGFAIDARNGTVRALGQTPTEQTPRSFTISSDSRFLYAAGQGSGRVAAFRIQKDGQLKRFATYDSGPISWWVIAVDGP